MLKHSNQTEFGIADSAPSKSKPLGMNEECVGSGEKDDFSKHKGSLSLSIDLLENLMAKLFPPGNPKSPLIRRLFQYLLSIGGFPNIREFLDYLEG